MIIPIFPGKYHQSGGFSMAYVSFQECSQGDSPSPKYTKIGKFFFVVLLSGSYLLAIEFGPSLGTSNLKKIITTTLLLGEFSNDGPHDYHLRRRIISSSMFMKIYQLVGVNQTVSDVCIFLVSKHVSFIYSFDVVASNSSVHMFYMQHQLKLPRPNECPHTTPLAV